MDVKIPKIKYTTNINKEVERVARQGYNNIRTYKKGLQHEYVDHFKLERKKQSNGRETWAITNDKKNMTWFLEKGHIIWNHPSTRVRAVRHVKPTVDQIKKGLQNINVRIQKGELK